MYVKIFFAARRAAGLLAEFWQSFGRVLAEFWQSFGRVLAEFWQIVYIGFCRVLAEFWQIFAVEPRPGWAPGVLCRRAPA
jgi:hypothetical protein